MKKPLAQQTETELQRLVMQYLVALGLNPRRYNVRVYGGHGRLHIPIRLANGKPDNGHPDLSVRTKHARIWMEFKAQNGVQSADQKAWQAECEALGETYVLVRSLDDVIRLFERRQ